MNHGTEPDEERPILIQDLTKEFNGRRVLDSLTLEIQRDRCVGFLGPNGAGKTTTIKILTGMLRPTSGKAYLLGIDVERDLKGALARTGCVVEIPEFYRELTPLESFQYLGRLRGMDRSSIERRSWEVLEAVRMKEWANERIGKFSKGMVQRIAVAQALLHEPEILILDEPTAGLDPRGMVEVRQLINSLKREEYTIFMSSHLLYEVQEICDRVAVIDRGKLLVYDDVDNLVKLRRLAKIEVDLLDRIDVETYEKVCGLEGVKGVQCPTGHKMFIDLEGDESSRARLLDEIRGLGLRVTSFKEAGVALESLYMDLVKESS